MSDLVERLRRRVVFAGADPQGPKFAKDPLCLEAADALEAAQARIKAVRRETVEECARIAEVQPSYPDTSTGMRQALIKAKIAAVIRALTEAKEDRT